MSISLQTNINSLVGQQNLDATEAFQSTTIQQLTSGFRINSAADDAAGLAVANGFRSSEAELTQGVQNANNATSTLQIADGGMNNISQMLDTLRSLSTESASGTFTGDRTILNNEFQSLLTEVNQQSQAVGLNQGGQFATDLSVYIGGGKDTTTGGFSASNGTLNINLSAATVDTQSLGLTGFQSVGNTSADLSAASTSSVSNIIGNVANTTATPGYTEFDFSGPGFSNGSQAKVTVNLQGVTDINTMVTALNSAIAATGTGASASDTAFQRAGVIASVHTDASGGQELAFTSSNTAFQVQAGDQMANALLGNIASGSTGASIASTVTGLATTASATAFTNSTNVAFQISGGGMTSPVTLNLGTDTTVGAAVTDITSQVANNTALKAAGITVSQASSTSPLVFTNAKGDQMNVEVTGDTAGALGFGSFAAGATTTAANYTTISGAAAVATATTTGSAALQFSFNGGASTAITAINLAQGDATAATATGSVTADATDAHGTALTISIDGAVATSYTLAAGSTTISEAATDINSVGSGLNALVTASVSSSGALVLTAVGKGGHSLTVGGAAATTFGINGTTSGTSRSAQSIADAINTGISGSTTLQAAGLKATVGAGILTIASTNGTEFRVSTSGSTAAPGAPSPSTGANIGFGLATGAAYSTAAAVSSAASTYADASGVSTSGTVNASGVLTNALTFGAMQFGSDTQAITVAANSADGTLESKTITLQNNATAQTGQSIDSAVNYINQELQQTNNPTLQSIVAVKQDFSGTEKINFIASNNAFSVSVGSSPNGNGFSGAAQSTVASSTLGTGTTVSIDTQQNAIQAVTALSAAVTKLGSAQAAVGTGENQLNYAIGLAQSQITNFSAAESRIRDADVAADAANLTKAQTLQQAGVAALAQANSAPQALLHLLQ